MHVLIVGAGAVGQVYGLALAHAGARVSFLVKPAHEARVREGLRLYRLKRVGQPKLERLEPAEVLTSVEAARAIRFDQVWLAVAADALEAAFTGGLVDAAGPEATIVYLQPGTRAKALLEARVPPERLVAGGIGMVAYETPLPGEPARETGTAFTFPGGTASRFSGAADRVRPIVDALRRGGCPAKAAADARRFVALTGAVLQPLVAGLELEGWSFRRLRRSQTIALVAGAGRQALALAAAELGVRPPWLRALVRPFALRLFLLAAPLGTPFPFEAYLERHFTKVGTQTRLALAEYAELAARHGLPADAVTELARRVGRPAQAPGSGGAP